MYTRCVCVSSEKTETEWIRHEAKKIVATKEAERLRVEKANKKVAADEAYKIRIYTEKNLAAVVAKRKQEEYETQLTQLKGCGTP